MNARGRHSRLGRLAQVGLSGVLLLALLGAPLLLATPAARPARAQPLRVGLITDTGTLADRSWNWLAYQGLLRAESELGVAGTVYTSTMPADFELNMQQCVSDSNDLCISVGVFLQDATWNAAQENPDTDFAILDIAYDSYPPNLRGILFAEEQGAYLAGTLAALMTESGIIGAIGGMPTTPVNNFVYGYRNGAQCAHPTVTVAISFTYDFANPDLGAQFAQGMMAGGADVIFAPAGATGYAAALTATQSGAWAIGVDTDWYIAVFGDGTVAGADRLLSSALKRLDNAVYMTIADLTAGDFAAGTVRYDLAAGGVGIAPYHDAEPAIPPAVRDQIEQVRQGIVSGTVDVWVPCHTHYVDGATGNDVGDCTNPVAPCRSVGYVLSQAQDRDTILVAQGIYTENITVDRPVALRGGYSGPPDWNGDLTQYETVLDGSNSHTVFGDWDDSGVRHAAVISDGSQYKMWYTGVDLADTLRIGYVTSTNGLTWTRSLSHPVLDLGAPGEWDMQGLEGADVLREGPTSYKMWYSGRGPDGLWRVGYATSTNGIDWVKYPGNPLIDLGASSWNNRIAAFPAVLYEDGLYKMWLNTAGDAGSGWVPYTAYATSTDGISWTWAITNPLFSRDLAHPWESNWIWAPDVLHLGDGYHMWYSAWDSQRGSTGYATSPDETSWAKYNGGVEPVLQGTDDAWDKVKAFHPEVLYSGGLFTMWYDSDSAIGVATSTDGISWTKSLWNPVFAPEHPSHWGQPVVTFAEGSAGALLDGFTVRHGDSDAGGGLLVANSGMALVANCVITANYAYKWGGGVWVTGADATISRTLIASNSTTLYGGAGIEVDNARGPARLTLESSTLRDNVAAHSGGGLHAWAAVATLRDVVFLGNTAEVGGGIDLEEGSSAVISGTRIVSNTAHTGGGISVEQLSTIRIANTVLLSNTAFWGGGLHVEGDSSGTLYSCRVQGNAAEGTGGGIRLLDNALLTMTNGLVAGNTSPHEGGFAGIEFAYPSSGGFLMNVTVADNAVPGGVGGIRHSDPSWPLTIVNSILHSNSGEQLRCENGGGCDVTYSDVAGGWSGTGNIDADPLFVGGGDYRLRMNSPCINAGTLAGSPALDLAGTPRDNWPDMGVYEWVGFRAFLPLVFRSVER